MNPRIFLLTMVTFAMGSAAFIFAGLLEELAADLHVPTEVAGQLQTAFVLTSALLGPVAAWLLRNLDRKFVIVLGLATGLALHLACYFAPNFQTLLILRAFAGLCGAMSQPAASVAAAYLAPPEKRGSALATVTGGVTLAFVLGIPLGSVVGAAFGWRSTFLVAAGLAAVALVGVIFFLPRIPAPPKRDGGKIELTHLWPLYATSFLAFAANMTLNIYIAPVVRVGAGVTGAGVAAFQMMIGLGSMAGLMLGGRAANRNIGKSWIMQGFIIQAVAMGTHFAATHHALPPGLPSKMLVGLAFFLAGTALFSMMPVLQSRLLQMTGGAPVALAVNGSVISMGQVLASSLGGGVLHLFGVPAIPAAAVGLSLTGLLILAFVFPRAAPPPLEKIG